MMTHAQNFAAGQRLDFEQLVDFILNMMTHVQNFAAGQRLDFEQLVGFI